MKTERELITRAARAWEPKELSIDDLVRRRDRKERNLRLGALVVGLAITISLAASGVAILRSDAVPADQRTTPTDFRRDGEFIVFAPSTTGAGWDLAAQDPETGDVRTIVETNGIADCVAEDQPCTTFIKEAEWSADGRWVAFRVTNRSIYGEPLPCGPTVGLWVATADGEPRQLTTPCDKPPSSPDVPIEEMWAWSSADDRLAYVRIDGETDELFLIDPSDGTRTSLGTGDVAPDYVAAIVEGRPGDWSRLASSLAWSPDRSQIAYVDGTSLYTVNVEDGERSLLSDAFGLKIIGIDWSPDGTQLMVHDWDRNLVDTVRVMNADGSDPHVLVHDEKAEVREASWSPTGDRIVYEFGLHGMELRTVAPDGSDPVKVFDRSGGCPTDSDDTRPVWAPDGTQVAYNDCGAWMVANADGTGMPQPIDYLVWRAWYSSGLAWWDLAGIAPI